MLGQTEARLLISLHEMHRMCCTPRYEPHTTYWERSQANGIALLENVLTELKNGASVNIVEVCETFLATRWKPNK